MITNTFTFKGSDGKEIFSHKWLPENGAEVKAVVQIAHGMAEHSARYERFAEMLTANNFGVYANDHRGHGQTAGTIENLGYFADNNGWDLVVSDLSQLTTTIKHDHPDIPVFLFGHSMGSFLCRDYMFTYPNTVSGVILSATACDPGLLGYAGIIISKIASTLKGKKSSPSRTPLDIVAVAKSMLSPMRAVTAPPACPANLPAVTTNSCSPIFAENVCSTVIKSYPSFLYIKVNWFNSIVFRAHNFLSETRTKWPR